MNTQHTLLYSVWLLTELDDDSVLLLLAVIDMLSGGVEGGDKGVGNSIIMNVRCLVWRVGVTSHFSSSSYFA